MGNDPLCLCDQDGRPLAVNTVLISAQHREEVDVETLLKPDIETEDIDPVLREFPELDSANARVLVVTPALNSPLRHLASDEDGARAAAQDRLDRSLSTLATNGIHARGQVGDGDPLQAIEDALRTFGADEIVISTHPEGRSNWLERGVVEHARERFAVPIRHVVVDLDRERERVRS